MDFEFYCRMKGVYDQYREEHALPPTPDQFKELYRQIHADPKVDSYDWEAFQDFFVRSKSPFAALFTPFAPLTDNFTIDWSIRHLATYAEAYIDCAKWLAELVPERRIPGGHHGLPILFLSRHGIELALKDCILQLYGLRRAHDPSFEPPRVTDKKVIEGFHTHQLQVLLNIVTREWRQSRNHLNGVLFISDEAAGFIRELDSIDPEAIAFRYPHDKVGQKLADGLQYHLTPFLSGIEHAYSEIKRVSSMVGITADMLEEYYAEISNY